MALDVGTGQFMWQQPTSDRPLHLAGVDDVILVGSDQGNVTVIDSATGATSWQGVVPGSIVSQPLVSNGVIVLTTGDGDVIAFDDASAGTGIAHD
jgi:outer membrane protein assembly factor BamB